MRLRPILALSVSLAWMPTLGHALGLGGIELKSGLNQPIYAEIELLQMRDLTADEVLASLAGPDEFERAGVAREFFLTDLHFEVKSRADGATVVVVTSRKPVREPFLNFLVEVLWPSGRLLREYTLLMDPPVYSERVAERVQSASSSQNRLPAISPPSPTKQNSSTRTKTSSPMASQNTQSRSRTSDVSAQTAAEPVLSSPTKKTTGPAAYAGSFEAATPETYQVRRNDTLWNVASLMRSSSDVSIPQMMLALQRSNPDAFIDDNINLLKKGEVLRAPTASETRALTRQEAVAEVTRQEQLWRQRLAARQGDLQSRAVEKPVISDATPARISAPDQPISGVLTLESGGDMMASSGAGGAKKEGGQAGLSQAAFNNELDRIRTEKQDAESRISDLETLIASNNSIITLQNDQISRLRERLKELEKQAELRASMADGVDEQKPLNPEPSKAALSQQESLAGVSDTEVNNGTLSKGERDLQEGEALSNEGDLKEATAPMSSTPSNVAPATEAPVTAAPIARTPPNAMPEKRMPEVANPQQQEVPFYLNPLYLASALGAAVVAGVLFLVFRRRDEGEDDEYDFLDEESDFDGEENEVLSDVKSTEDEMSLLDIGDEEEGSLSSTPTFDDKIGHTPDIISEADIFMAYGRFSEARDLLTSAIEKDPLQPDQYLKLMEVCVETKDAKAFLDCEAQMKQYNMYDDYSDRIRTLRDHFGPELLDNVRSKVGQDDAFTSSATAGMQTEEDHTVADMSSGGLFDEVAKTQEIPVKQFATLDKDFDVAPAEGGSPTAQFTLNQGDTLGLGDTFDPSDALGDVDTNMPSLEDLESSLTADFSESLSTNASFAEPDVIHHDDDHLADTVMPVEEEVGSGVPLSVDTNGLGELDHSDVLSLEDNLHETLDLDDTFGENDVLSDMDVSALAAELDDVFETGESISLNEDSPMMNMRSKTDHTAQTEDLIQPVTEEPEGELEDIALAPTLAPVLLGSEFQSSEFQSSEFQSSEFQSSELEDSELEGTEFDVSDSDVSEFNVSEPSVLGSEYAEDDLVESLEFKNEVATVSHIHSEQNPYMAGNDVDNAQEGGSEDGLDSDADLTGSDETATKLDLARAYLDMGDRVGARDILDEVVQEGNAQQQEEAKALLKKVS